MKQSPTTNAARKAAPRQVEPSPTKPTATVETPAPVVPAARPIPAKIATGKPAVARPTASPPPAGGDVLRERLATDRVPAWVLLPLRLFLGITFVYAGLQKLTDPQFFDPHASGYIGKQLAAFARNSPLHDLLVQVAVPHASLFGGLVAYGELAIGLGVLLGLLLRPAAFFGALLSLIFFLTVSWNVHPYFYGPDIVFCFAWLPIIFAGPSHMVLPALDDALTAWLWGRATPAQHTWLVPALAFVLGTDVAASAHLVATEAVPAPKGSRAAVRAGTRPRQNRASLGRRDFLWGAGAGGVGMLGLAWLWSALRPAASTVVTSTPVAVATETGTATATGTAVASNVIAQASAVTANSAVAFTIPTNGDPGVLVRTAAGKLVAFDATCTHAGCPVQYDASSQLLQCPCHGAAFDPTQNAAVVQGPAQTPLTPLTITVDQKTGNVTLAS